MSSSSRLVKKNRTRSKNTKAQQKAAGTQHTRHHPQVSYNDLAVAEPTIPQPSNPLHHGAVARPSASPVSAPSTVATVPWQPQPTQVYSSSSADQLQVPPHAWQSQPMVHSSTSAQQLQTLSFRPALSSRSSLPQTSSHPASAQISFSQSMGPEPEPPKIRKILSLDGGGVRGLSIIIILKSIMKRLNRQRKINLDPWEEFDMIGGTSTGGIIAIMLGRLRMSLEECQAAYSLLSETVFTRVHDHADPRGLYKFPTAKGRFDEAPLEDSIKSTLWSKGLTEDELLQEEDKYACKVFVCASRGENNTPISLRSYVSERHDPLYEICKIWEAVRATSAASTFFEPIKIGSSAQRFVDGSLAGRYNPIRQANIESSDIWPEADRLIISIGTGAAPSGDITGNLLSLPHRLKEAVTQSEQTNKDFRTENSAMVRNGRLYRFNVLQGLGDIGLEEHKAIPRIATYTDNYLDDPDIFDMISSCVGNLSSGGQRLGRTSPEGL